MWLWTTPAALATILTAAIGFYVLRRPPAPPLWPSVPCVLGAALLFSAGELLGTTATTLTEAWIAVFVLYTGVITVAPSIWTMTLRFAEANRVPFSFGRSPWARLPYWVAGVWLLALFTGPLHGELLTPRIGERNTYHALWYLMAGSSWGLVLASVGLLVTTARRAESPRVRTQAHLVIAGCLAPLPFNLLYVSLPTSLPSDPTSLGLAAAGLLFVAGIYRQRLFALSPLAFWDMLSQDTDAVLVLDENHRLIFANPAAHDLLGGLPLTPGDSPLTALVQSFAPDGRGPEASIEELLRPERDRGRTYHRPGESIRWLRVEPTPLTGSDGRPLGACLRIRDDTPLREATDATARQAATLTSILGATQDGFIVTDLRDVILYVNDACRDLFDLDDLPAGIAPEDLAARITPKVDEPRDSEKVVLRALRNPTGIHYGDVGMADGRQIEWGYYPLLEDGELAGRIWQIRDVTAQREAANDLLEARKLESLRVIAGGVAHDFNNLLAVIQGNAALARRGAPPDLGIGRFLGDIETAASRASDLTEQLLAYAGKTTLKMEQHDLSTTVREVRQLIEVSIPKRIELDWKLSPGLPTVRGDAGQLRQVVMNLVLNAAESLEGGPGGTVRLETGVTDLPREARTTMPVRHPRAGTYVYFRVEDTGCGIRPSDLERIFEPFYSTKFTGRGLGLAATAGVIRTHRGGLSVESRPGAGSTFTAFLPAGDDS